MLFVVIEIFPLSFIINLLNRQQELTSVLLYMASMVVLILHTSTMMIMKASARMPSGFKKIFVVATTQATLHRDPMSRDLSDIGTYLMKFISK